MIRQMTNRGRWVEEYMRRLIAQNNDFFFEQAVEIRLLLNLLLGHLLVRAKWTSDELAEMKLHLKNSVRMIYVFGIILLPGGLLFLPFAAGILHRAKH